MGKATFSRHKRRETRHSAKCFAFRFWVLGLIVAVLAAVPFGLGKYIEFNTPGPYDSGAYVYSAKHILDGAGIGVEEKPSAQTGTLLVNMLGVWLFGFGETGPELIQTLLQAGALLLMFIAMRKLFGMLPAAVGVIIASVYLSAPLIAKFGNVKEQYMIAFMLLAVSCFVFRQLRGKWYWVVLAGAFAIWAPLFKQTGTSVIAAIGLFVLAQAVLKHRSWPQTGTDILLLLAGAAISIGPVYLWLAGAKAPVGYWPYSFLFRPMLSAPAGSQEDAEHTPAESEANSGTLQDRQAGAEGSRLAGTQREGPFAKFLPRYVRGSWQILKPGERKEVALRVGRYYRLLILPIALALGAIAARLVRMIMSRAGKLRPEDRKGYERFVLLFAIWWLLDMAFVWVSPRSYEQYYLPLNASAAMLGGYLIALYSDRLATSVYKTKWGLIGLVGFICMMIMSWHIFFGIEKSPHSGLKYPSKRRGYLQRLEMASQHRKGAKGPWEVVGEYIRHHSGPDERIYVWGWYPGIYVKAQRLSPVPQAFEGTMHTLSPEALSQRIDEILTAFEKQPPKFIVDSRKQHFPWDRPPLELWPRTPQGFLPPDKQIMDRYDAVYSEMLREKIEPDEAERFEAMRPLREFVMKNYKIVQPFGQHVLFEHK